MTDDDLDLADMDKARRLLLEAYGDMLEAADRLATARPELANELHNLADDLVALGRKLRASRT